MATKDITDKQVCEAYVEYNRNRGAWPYEILHQRTGEHWKVCFRACERAAKRGLVDYGVSLRSGWLTTSGEKLAGG